MFPDNKLFATINIEGSAICAQPKCCKERLLYELELNRVLASMGISASNTSRTDGIDWEAVDDVCMRYNAEIRRRLQNFVKYCNEHDDMDARTAAISIQDDLDIQKISDEAFSQLNGLINAERYNANDSLPLRMLFHVQLSLLQYQNSIITKSVKKWSPFDTKSQIGSSPEGMCITSLFITPRVLHLAHAWDTISRLQNASNGHPSDDATESIKRFIDEEPKTVSS